MQILRIIIFNLLNIFILLLFLEITFRGFFPEFKDHIHSESKTMNISYHSGEFFGHQVRSPTASESFIPESNKPLVLIFGDSISGGYGTAYEDIWWQKLERFLSIRGIDVDVESIHNFGNNMQDNADNIHSIVTNTAASSEKNISKVIYQFNFNDLLPLSSSDLEAMKNDAIDISFAKFRYEYLNKSVFLRTAQHYAGKLVRKTSGSCSERGFDALGAYSYTFGVEHISDDANNIWINFEDNLSKINSMLSNEGIDFEIFISPIIFDVDLHNAHPHFNYLNYDFSCATIDPRKRLHEFSDKHNIKIYDPFFELRRSFEARISEGNFEPYFFAGDDNHFTPTASTYVAEIIAKEW